MHATRTNPLEEDEPSPSPEYEPPPPTGGADATTLCAPTGRHRPSRTHSIESRDASDRFARLRHPSAAIAKFALATTLGREYAAAAFSVANSNARVVASASRNAIGNLSKRAVAAPSPTGFQSIAIAASPPSASALCGYRSAFENAATPSAVAFSASSARSTRTPFTRALSVPAARARTTSENTDGGVSSIRASFNSATSRIDVARCSVATTRERPAGVLHPAAPVRFRSMTHGA